MHETRCYNRPFNLNAEQLIHALHSHSQVESMYRMLNTTFKGDKSVSRKGNGAFTFDVMRKMALS